MVVTANEIALQTPAYYNISFHHDLTKHSVNVNGVIDESPYPHRYNRFSIDISLFNSCDNGFYSYAIFDPDMNILEVGKMKLIQPPSIPVQYKNYPTEYSTYGG